MPIDFKVDKDAGILRIEISGKTVEKEWTDMLSAVAADPDLIPGTGLFIDVRRHETVATSEVMWKISQTVRPGSANSRWAIVVSRVVSEGMSFMLSALVEKSGIQVKVFRDPEEAEAWLKGGD